MKRIQRTGVGGRWTWPPPRARRLRNDLVPFLRALERDEWGGLRAQRVRDEVPRSTSGSRLGGIDLEAESLLPGRDLRLGASVAAVGSALNAPEGEIGPALRQRGLSALFVDGRLVELVADVHARSISLQRVKNDHEGEVWGEVGADTTRGDLGGRSPVCYAMPPVIEHVVPVMCLEWEAHDIGECRKR